MVLLALTALACALAPMYARYISGTDGFRSNINGHLSGVGDVVQQNEEGLGLGATPIGPTWSSAYFLGADSQGRDIVVRLLYGGRTSLSLAATAAAVSMLLALPTGVLGGFAGGMTDLVMEWLLDLIWAFPVYLLAISLASVLTSQDLALGPIRVNSGSLLVPVVVLGVVYFPYVARPLRSEIGSLAHADFLTASKALGGSSYHLLRGHIIPAAVTRLILFAPILLAFDLLTEATLSVLSLGVQAPTASWGSLIGDGQSLLYVRPMAAIAPGLAVIATVLTLNVLTQRVQTAFDTRRQYNA